MDSVATRIKAVLFKSYDFLSADITVIYFRRCHFGEFQIKNYAYVIVGKAN